MPRPTALAFLVPWLASALVAQAPDPIRPQLHPGNASIFNNTGLGTDDTGQLLGTGPRYDVRFLPSEVLFTPVLGKAAPRDLPLGYRLQAIGRGRAEVHVPPATPQVDGRTVRYRHGMVDATYELREGGVKQSFVFSVLPAGDGDLIVRAAIASELQPGEIDGDGVKFELPGVGGVHVGAVVGIDATGKEARGTMRWHAGALEFVLPDAFVDAAALPLVLDPLLGVVTTLGAGNDDLVPDIAYDASTDLYLVVWQRDISLLNQDVRGQRLSGAGALIGGTLTIESSSTSASRPHVANVNLRDAFVVAWQQAGDIQARGVDASTGTLSAILAVAATADTETQVDIGGELNDSADDDALCVWANTTTGDIEARQVTYTAAGTLAVSTLVTFANPLFSTYSNPCISQNGGGAGIFLICWDSFGSLSNKTTVRGTVVTRNLGVTVPDFQIATHTFDARDPDCDGDGDRAHWVVAFEREEAAGGDTDVWCVPLHVAGATAVLGQETFVDNGIGDDERDPAICWLQDSCLVAWSDEASASNYDTYVTSLSPLRCGACEGRFALDTSTADTSSFPAMAWRYRATNVDNNGAMVVWQAFDIAGSTGDIEFVRFDAEDGAATPIAGGCGAGGTLLVKCMRGGNADFRFELRGAAASATALLVLSPTRVDYACGPCTLVPDPWRGFVAAFTTTNATGDANRLLALPAGVGGIELYAQWLGTGSLCFSGFDFSNAARVRLQ